ncbi:hypothetical protein LSCM4_03687 [Leishmania orientalis]|uniref:Uncharacterized protein n=1 Tax=Leishmania orientalis TaxID=2249476 RepID=A0A836KI31_9TRYP|nr:hypothetical protein LSCM4_03687 [Leishmania orientalis]
MAASLSPSQLAAQEAASSLMVDDDGTPYHDSRPIPRLPIDGDVAVSFAPIKVIKGATDPRGVCSPLSAAAEEGLFHGTGKNTTWMEVQQSTRPPPSASYSGRHACNHDSHLSTVSRTDSGSPQRARVHRDRTADPRHLERLAQPRGNQGSSNRRLKPNYGRLLNFEEEEERYRQLEQQRRDQPLSPSRGSNPCAETARSARTQSQSSLTESEYHASPATTAMPATQMAYKEKLATPKKAYPVRMVGSDSPPRRTSLAETAPHRGDGNTFDRLAAPTKPTAPSFDESIPSPLRQTRFSSCISRASTPLQRPEQQVLYQQRLAMLKQGTALSQRFPHAPAGHDLHTTKKRYYGGTTVISASPSKTCPATLPLPPPPLAGGRRSGGVPRASWEDLANYSERRASAPAASSSLSPGLCTACRTALPQQAYTVSSQSVPIGIASGCKGTVEEVPAVQLKLSYPAPAASSDGPTLVQSTPAKATGSKPPMVVRTRRYVPPSDEQDTEAVGQSASDLAKEEGPAALAPEPVEAVRRRFATPTVPTETASLPASSMQETADIRSMEPPARATLTPAAVQAVRPASPPPPRPAEVAARPAAVQATKRVYSAPAITASAPAPRKPVALEDSRLIPAPCSVPVAPESSGLESPLLPLQAAPSHTQAFSPSWISSSAPASDQLVAGALPKVATAEENDAVAVTSDSASEDVYVIPPSPVSGKKGSRKSMRKQSHKAEQEVLKNEDFACQLEVFSPESYIPFITKKQPKAAAKAKVSKALPPRKTLDAATLEHGCVRGEGVGGTQKVRTL